MNIINIIQNAVQAGIKSLYATDISTDQVILQPTRREFEGDYTVVTFALAKAARKAPPVIAEELGKYLAENVEEISGYNVIKGFLNISVSNVFWQNFLDSIANNADFGKADANGKTVMVEFSSPNTNKPLHLGHVRNILLGWSTAKIHEAAGYDVKKVQIINDRGIAICKSMLAWQKYGEGATPEKTGKKADHFVGYYYVLFEQKFKAEYAAWQESTEGQAVLAKHQKEGQEATAFFKSYKNKYFNEYSVLGNEAKDMLLRWEAKDEATRQLWALMNSWVYQGFEKTYENLGVSFDKLYYESDTYLLGKDMVEKGLKKGVFQTAEDNSVFIDLTDAKMDIKTILRGDGTSLYITQDIGTANARYEDFKAEKMIYVVADEQNYHFKVLFETLKRLGEPYADGLYHLSYGMVELPEGKMKSREGTVVDADDLMAEVIEEARQQSAERGETEGLAKEEKQAIIRKIGMAALKFQLIKVQPKKWMTFDPKESVDMQGQTGPYVQNAYVRVRSVLRKVNEVDLSLAKNYDKVDDIEKGVIAQLYAFPATIKDAAEQYEPSAIANYCYELAKSYHRFYHDHSILKAESKAAKAFRLQLSMAVANALKLGMDLLGIEMPERM